MNQSQERLSDEQVEAIGAEMEDCLLVSDYQRLWWPVRAELKRLQAIETEMLTHVQDLAQKYDTIEAERDRYKAALEWYAEDEQYGRIRIMPPIPDIPILHDCGERAKKELEGADTHE